MVSVKNSGILQKRNIQISQLYMFIPYFHLFIYNEVFVGKMREIRVISYFLTMLL